MSSPEERAKAFDDFATRRDRERGIDIGQPTEEVPPGQIDRAAAFDELAREREDRFRDLPGAVTPARRLTEEEIRERLRESERREARRSARAEVLETPVRAAQAIASFPGRLRKEFEEEGVRGVARGIARGAAEEAAKTTALLATGLSAIPDVPVGAGGFAPERISTPTERAQEFAPVVQAVQRGAEAIEPFEGSPSQRIGQATALGAESIVAAPAAAKVFGRIPGIGRPFRLVAEELRLRPGETAVQAIPRRSIVFAEEAAGALGAEEALAAIEPESVPGTIGTAALGGGIFTGVTGLVRGAGRQLIRTGARFTPGAARDYRDTLPSHLRERPYRLAHKELRGALARGAPPGVRTAEEKRAATSVIERIDEAGRLLPEEAQPTLGAVSGVASVAEHERLVLRQEPFLHRQLQERRQLAAANILQEARGLVDPGDLERYRSSAETVVESTLDDVENAINAARRTGGPLATDEIADALTKQGGRVTDVSPRTGQVFLDARSRLGLEFVRRMDAEDSNLIRRGGVVYEVEPARGTPGILAVRAREVPTADATGGGAVALGIGLQEAHDEIFSDIWRAYDDVGKLAGNRLIKAPKINKAIRAARHRGGVQPEFLPPEMKRINALTTDPERSGRFNRFTLREIFTMVRDMDNLLNTTTNEQMLESRKIVWDALEETLDDIGKSRLVAMREMAPLARDVQRINTYRREATSRWRSGLAELVQGRDPSDTMKFVLSDKPENITRLAEAVRERPELGPLAQDAIVEHAFAYSSKPLKNGRRVIDSDRLAKFRDQFREQLAQFPEANEILQNVADAQARADDLGLPNSMTGHRAAMGTISSFVDNPSAEIDAILAKSPGERMREVGRWMSRFQGDQDGIQAFRYAMWDRLMARSAKADTSLKLGPYNYLNSQFVLDTIEENRGMLTQLYGADHVARMEKFAELSNIVQKMASDQHVTAAEEDLLAQAGRTWFYTSIAQIYSKFIKLARGAATGVRLINALDHKRSQELLAEWYANPKAAKLALSQINVENEPAMIRAMGTAAQLPWLKDLGTMDELERREHVKRQSR